MNGGSITKYRTVCSFLFGVMLFLTVLSGHPAFRYQAIEESDVNTDEEGILDGTNSQISADAFFVTSGNQASGFIENKGQYEHPEILYRFEGQGTSIGFLESEYVVVLSDGEDTISVIRITFPGSSAVSPVGEMAMDHPTTYYLGNDPDSWVQGVDSYSRLVYREVYPGIDLAFSLRDGSVKYDWIVAPNADPNVISQRYEGDGQPTISGDGSISFVTPTGTLTEHAPVSFQATDRGQQRNIQTAFRLVEGSTITYTIHEYDPSRILVIDPLLSTTLFGSYLTPSDMVLDEEDNIYLVGVTFMDNFPTVPGTYNHEGTNWFPDMFFCKFNRRMSRLEFAGIVGGDCHDIPRAMDLDADGNLIITGTTRSSDLPVTSDAINYSIEWGGNAGFLMKISANGSQLLFSTLLPWGDVKDMAIDEDGVPYLMGTTAYAVSELPTHEGTYDNQTHNSTTAYIMKFDYTNLTPIYATYLGGANAENPTSMEMGDDGSIYITGTTGSPDFPTTHGCFNSIHDAMYTIFVSKFDPTLSSLKFSTFIHDVGFGQYTINIRLAVDPDGNAIISGSTINDTFPVTDGSQDSSFGGSEDIYLSKLNQNGTDLLFSTYLGGNEYKWERTNSIAIDDRGYIFIAGETNSEDFPVTTGCFQDRFGGGGGIHNMGDCFISIFTPDGTLEYSTYVGGAGEEFTSKIVLDSDGNAVVAGYFRTTPQNFPLIPGGYSMSGGEDAIALFKLLTSATPQMYIDSVTPDPALDTDAIRLKGHAISDSPVDRYVWTVDGEEVYNGTKMNIVISPQDSGTHTIGFRGLNLAGYWSKEITDELIVHTRPASIIDSIIPNPTLDTDPVNLSGHGTDDGAIVEYSWRVGDIFHNSTEPGIIVSPSHFPSIPPSLPTASLPIGFRVRDNYGVWSNETKVDLLVVSRPEAVIIPANRTLYAADELVPLTGSWSDARTITQFQWTSSLEGLVSNGIEPTVDVTGLTSGTHSISLRILDEWGFWSNESSFQLKITERPIATINSLTPNPALDIDIIEFMGSASDDDTITTYRWTSSIDGVLWEGSDPYFTTIGLSIGTHTISFTTRDEHGFWSHQVTSQIVVIGQPISIIDSLTPNPLASDESLLLTGNGTDDGSITQYFWTSDLDGDLITTADVAVSLSGLSVGIHTISLRTRDDLGFWSNRTSILLTVHERPVATISNISPSPTIVGTLITFQGQGTDDGMITAYFWSSDKDGELSPLPEFTTSSLSRGVHTISLSVQDDLGCWSQPATQVIVIMSRPISVITNISHEAALIDEEITFSGYAIDDGPIEEVMWRSSIDDTIGDARIITTTDLSPGQHQITFRAKDEHGLWSDEAIRYLTIHARPTASIVSVEPSSPTSGDFLILTGKGTDDGEISRYQWFSTLDGELFNGTWEGARISPLSQGTHTLSLRVQDEHGVWSEESHIEIMVNKPESNENDGSLTMIIAAAFVLTGLGGILMIVLRMPGSKFEK